MGKDGVRKVITIGTFDGVHAGHQALVARCRAIADAHAAKPAVAALVFDPSPQSVLRPDVPGPARLTTFEQRERLLLEAGADEVHRLVPTKELLSLSGTEFIASIVRQHGPIACVEGGDFRFGRGREGDVALLAKLGAAHGFRCEVVEPVSVTLTDHSIVPARSTMARWLLAQGRVRDVACVLGRPYTMPGTIVSGDRRGRTIGFPTANLDSPCMVPADGVYSGIASLPDGRSFPAAVSIGTKPTFEGRERAVEAFLILTRACDGGAESTGRSWRKLDGLPEYGWSMELALLGWVRDQARFESTADLCAQMLRDCERVLNALSAEPPRGSITFARGRVRSGTSLVGGKT